MEESRVFIYVSGDANLDPKNILQGRMTSSPFKSMCFLSSVMQYCGLSSVETAYYTVQTVADKLFILGSKFVNGI